MRKKSLNIKIMIPTVLILTALAICLNIFWSVRFTSISATLIDEKLTSNANSLKTFLDDSMAKSMAGAVSAANNANMIKALSERDTNGMLALLSGMKELYRINYFTITDSEGTVILRSNNPDFSGDSILAQKNIQNALNGTVSSYFEEGTVAKVSARTGAPVYDTGGTLIGVVSAAVRFDDEAMIHELKRLYNSEISVFLGDIRVVTTIERDGQNIAGTALDQSMAEKVLQNKQEYIGDAYVLGERYRTFYVPLINNDNIAFAAFFLGIPYAEMISASANSIRDGAVLSLFGLAVSISLLSFVVSSISKPITKLSENTENVANGNLLVDIGITGEDEIGRLGESLQRAVDIVRKLLDEINIMIAEHDKGNIDYCLDAEPFQGDYRILVDNILELASFGMRDQLTGMPNRRSFDNRLEWEWKRSIREQEPLSILILDVDKFKVYNDSFGHPQGDVALQTVAESIRQVIQRSVDFAARWGGEEFVVLLPTTDTAGAIKVAEKIRKQIEEAVVPCHDEKAWKITASIGVNTHKPPPDGSFIDFIATADAALYMAKASGRNKVVHGAD